jgi:hypothetical protein
MDIKSPVLVKQIQMKHKSVTPCGFIKVSEREPGMDSKATMSGRDRREIRYDPQ